MSHLLHYWTVFEKIGRDHGVDPVIFAALYVAHWIICGAIVAWIIVWFRQKKDISGLISLWVFFLISPWFYPLLFGHLPWCQIGPIRIPYADAGLVAAMIFIAWHGYHKIVKRVAKERKLMAPAPENT
jgi:hypothetical protein